MKKMFCLLLTVIFILTIGGTCFAAEDDKDIGDDGVAGASSRNVNSATYKEENKTIEDKDPETSTDTIEIQEETLPAGLPNTGGIPAEVFYAAGALFIIAALFVMIKKTKAGQKN